MNLNSYNVFVAANKKDLAAVSVGFNPPFVVMIPEGTEEVTSDAFCNDDTVGMLLLPNSVKKIGDGAFSNCENLTHITIPDSVTEIEASAFFNCGRLFSITIPDTVTSLGNELFYHCGSLVSVKLPKGLTEITFEMFDGCRNLYSVEIPKSVTKISESAFFGCPTLTDIYIPSGVKEIGSFAFKGCTALAHINIPDSVKTVGDRPFAGCSNLKIVYSTNSIVANAKHPSKIMIVDPNISSPAFEKKLKAAFPSITDEEIKEEIDFLTNRYFETFFLEDEEAAEEIDMRELEMIQECYDKPMFALQMRWNKKYRTNEFDGMVPYICINDLVNYKYVICAIPNDEAVTLLMEMNRRNVVKEYDSLESMVADGWRIGD